MALGSGVNKKIKIKKEVTFGLLVVDATNAQSLPRVSSDLNLAKNIYQSQEIVESYQHSDVRHGTRRVEGTINGEFHPGTYQHFWQSLLRRDWAAVTGAGALTNVTAAAGPPGTFTRATGSWITDGYRVGMTVRCTGWTTTGAANNNVNYPITALTTTVMTVAGTVAAKASGDSVTIAVPGKVTYVPTSGHTNDSYSIEEWHSDIAKSRRFTGCRLNTCAVNLPATGLAQINWGVLGQDLATAGTEYFTSPTAAPSTGIFAGVSGLVRAAGSQIVLTGAQFNFAGGMQVLEVVGSNLTPDVFPGRVTLTGQLTAPIQDFTLLDLFVNETEAELFQFLTTGSAANADFFGIYCPRIKVNSASFDDGEKPLIQTGNFQALKGTGATGYQETTVLVQDSTLV